MQIKLSDGSGVINRHPDLPSQFIQPRHVDVWLPRNYDMDTNRQYPVLYMHDGQNLFDPGLAYGGVDWGIDEAVSSGVDQNLLPEILVVGIWNSPLRWCEYLPQEPWAAFGGERLQHNLWAACPDSPCISDLYLRFIVEELKPMIDSTYRTLKDFEHTAVMGSSMGGLISLYALCRYPSIFSRAGCISTHWPAGEEFLVDYFGASLPEPGKHKIYFDYGDQTLDARYEPYQNRMDDLLIKNGFRREIDFKSQKFIGAEHSEQSWRERVHIPLQFLFGLNNRPIKEF